MFFAEAQIRVHLYGQPTDMRKSYDGLQALARHAMDVIRSMARSTFSSIVAVHMIKCLYFDRSGFCIWGKPGSRRESSSAIGARCALARWIDGVEVAARGLEGKRIRNVAAVGGD